MLTHTTNIRYLKGVGEKRAQSLARLGIDTVGALLSFYPRAYKDFSNIQLIYDSPFEQTVTVKARIVSPVNEHYIRKNMTLYKFKAADDSGVMEVTLFNNKYLAQRLHQGSTYLFHGKITGGFYLREMSAPEIYEVNLNRILPVYPQNSDINSKYLSKLVGTALQSTELEEIIPNDILEKYGLCDIKTALEGIHFPKSMQSIEVARKRLVFEELYLLSAGMQYLKNRNRGKTAAVMNRDYTKAFFDALPFELTNSQRKCIDECVKDMAKGVPMGRLLQGDVGSGKTAVAAAVAYNAVRNGYQAIVMAPTVILAEQHYATFVSFLEKFDIKCALLTSSLTSAKKRKIFDDIKEGRYDVIIGTHAVINEKLQYDKVGLVITDEQHRFGVAQREALSKKGESPHTLVMSATPIPRTLAMTVYGELDVSVINEYPKGRQKIDTYSVTEDKKTRAYNYVKQHLDEGRQAYIVCPLVEQGENERASAEEIYNKLQQGFFKDYTVGLLHGKMTSSQKEKIMGQFASGEVQLLVSTTVIEVGIDVPNAAIILIEDAELFGLSQLHQLRGRVGRGGHKSSCILLSKNMDKTNNERLRVICETQDGFRIAEEDLKLRGPGDFLGKRQHGLPELKIADFIADYEVFAQTKEAARFVLQCDPNLSFAENKALRERILHMFCI